MSAFERNIKSLRELADAQEADIEQCDRERSALTQEVKRLSRENTELTKKLQSKRPPPLPASVRARRERMPRAMRNQQPFKLAGRAGCGRGWLPILPFTFDVRSKRRIITPYERDVRVNYGRLRQRRPIIVKSFMAAARAVRENTGLRDFRLVCMRAPLARKLGVAEPLGYVIYDVPLVEALAEAEVDFSELERIYAPLLEMPEAEIEDESETEEEEDDDDDGDLIAQLRRSVERLPNRRFPIGSRTKLAAVRLDNVDALPVFPQGSAERKLIEILEAFRGEQESFTLSGLTPTSVRGTLVYSLPQLDEEDFAQLRAQLADLPSMNITPLPGQGAFSIAWELPLEALRAMSRPDLEQLLARVRKSA